MAISPGTDSATGPRRDAATSSGGPPAGAAWDEQRPPTQALIDDCVHCGFCLPTCPTYALWGEEMDSPRGRIQLMQLGHEQSELSTEMVSHFDRCLGCMACVTACPSGVKYDLLLQETRPQIERNFRRPAPDRAFRRLIFTLFPHPGRLRTLVPGLVLQRRLRLERLLPSRLPRLRAMAAMAPEVPLRAAWQTLPAVTPARGEKRGTVALLQGCVQRVFFSKVNRATVEVLSAEGYEVHAPRAPRCCGSLQLHTGYEPEAQTCARETVAAFAEFDTVIVNAAGCGSGMKDYGHLIGNEEFPAKVFDVHEFLAQVEPRAERHSLPLRVASPRRVSPRPRAADRRSASSAAGVDPCIELLSPRDGSCAAGRPGSTTCPSPRRPPTSVGA